MEEFQIKCVEIQRFAVGLGHWTISVRTQTRGTGYRC